MLRYKLNFAKVIKEWNKRDIGHSLMKVDGAHMAQKPRHESDPVNLIRHQF